MVEVITTERFVIGVEGYAAVRLGHRGDWILHSVSFVGSYAGLGSTYAVL